MALLIKRILFNGLEAGYHRIGSYSFLDDGRVKVVLESYRDAAGRATTFIPLLTTEIACPFSGNTENMAVEAYAYIKTLPEWAAAIDDDEGESSPAGESLPVFVPPDVAEMQLDQAKAAMIAALAAYRFGRETGGVTVNGINILTDRESQATLTGAYVAVQLKPTRLIKWKGSDGVWTQIDKATVEFLAGAVADHVEACFDVESDKAAEIQALTTVEAVQAYDVTVGW